MTENLKKVKSVDEVATSLVHHNIYCWKASYVSDRYDWITYLSIRTARAFDI